MPPFPDLDEPTAGNKKRRMAIAEPALREPKRDDGYAGEYAANYVRIYDDELEVGDSEDAQVECDQIAASGRHVNPREPFRWSYSIPPNSKWIGPEIPPSPLWIGPLGRPDLRMTRQYWALPKGQYTTESLIGSIWRGYRNRAAMRRRPYEWCSSEP